jgi:hypothetical protein
LLYAVARLHNNSNVPPQKFYQCEPKFVDAGYCNTSDIGEFILTANATEKSKNVILTKAMHLKDSVPINYPIRETGYYCVLAFGYSSDEFEALAEFRNAYGELPAAQIPKLPFYGGITLLYAVVSVYVYAGKHQMDKTNNLQVLGFPILPTSFGYM